jgi:hypothetical protein
MLLHRSNCAANAGRQARLEVGAQRTLEAVACTPMFGMGVVSKHTELGRKLLVLCI